MGQIGLTQKRSQVGTGVIIGKGAPSVIAEGVPVSVKDDLVSAHGAPPHTSPTIANGSLTVFAEDKPVTVTDISKASCSHAVITGATSVNVGS